MAVSNQYQPSMTDVDCPRRPARSSATNKAQSEVLVGMQARASANQLVEYAESRVAVALRRLLAEDVEIARAAELCELRARDVLRLSRYRRRSKTAA